LWQLLLPLYRSLWLKKLEAIELDSTFGLTYYQLAYTLDWKHERVVKLDLKTPEKTPRELAFNITDKEGYFISESSV
jgi:hypothetical protein